VRFTTIIFTLISISLSLCGPDSKNKEEFESKEQTIKQDSLLEITEAKKKKYQDSITLIEEDKAIGNIKFGIPKSIAGKEINKFKKQFERKEPGYSYLTNIYIGEFKAIQILDFYYDNKLYYLLIQGGSILWENYDSELPRQVQFINDVIEQNYGKAQISNDIEPRHRMQNGSSYLIKRWDIGKKRIDIRIADNSTSYMINVEIFLPGIESKVNSEKLKKEKESTEKAKDVF
jgi:hypothetical protein